MSQPNTSRSLARPIHAARASPQVTALPGYYLVRLPALFGWSTHLVRKDRTCACPLAGQCPAVEAVAEYLRQGGARAPDPPPDSLIPERCPICGGVVHFEPRLCSPVRGAGWVCAVSARLETTRWPDRYWYPGEKHFWLAKWEALRQLRFGGEP